MTYKHNTLPGFLALTLAVFWASVAGAAPVSVKSQMYKLEVTGGSGAAAWTLRYGTYIHVRVSQELATIGDIAYFSHGFWLRRIDTRRGVVTGRWRFPWQIASITPEGDKVRVEIAESADIAHPFRHSVLLDPKAPQIPNWPGGDPVFSVTEAAGPWRLGLTGTHLTAKLGISADRARQILPEVEEMVRRDPLSPWFQITQAALLRTLGDARASVVFRQAVDTPGADYMELFRMSAFLSQMKEQDAAREAFERGYRDFLNRGFEPRLVRDVFRRRTLFPAFEADEAWMERSYRLGPHSDASSLAWQIISERFEKQGQAEQAKLWKDRAADPRSLDRLFPAYDAITVMMYSGVILLGAGFSTWGYLFVLFWRYRAQRMQDRAAGSKPWATLLRLEYAGRRERAAALGLILAATTAVGLYATFGEAAARLWRSSQTLWSGSLAGPVNEWYLEKHLPATKERSLLLAVAYQQGGEDDKAERLYRELPDFAESWNNLGVILKKRGKDPEARTAFETALRQNSGLAEAELNLRGSSRDYWAAQYARMFPGRLMIAPPRGDRFRAAFLGRPLWQSYLRALAGPLLIKGQLEMLDVEQAGLRRSMLILLSIVVAWLLIVPQKRVSLPAGWTSRVAEALLPGSSRAWLWLGGLLGGFVMVAWVCLVFIAVARVNHEVPFGAFGPLGTWGPPLRYTYGVEGTGEKSAVAAPVVACALLFLVNLALVVRSWKREKSVGG